MQEIHLDSKSSLDDGHPKTSRHRGHYIKGVGGALELRARFLPLPFSFYTLDVYVINCKCH